MIKVKANENLVGMNTDYIFSETARLIADYDRRHPDKPSVRLGIGDATLPIAECVIRAMSEAALELRHKNCGYQPENGRKQLRELISKYYLSVGCDVSADEVYVSDGAKSDLGNLFDILGKVTVVMQRPYYPAYFDGAAMRGLDCIFIRSDVTNNFISDPDEAKITEPSVIILNSPNNPTGVVYPREILEKWVALALNTGSLIIFDAAYSSFVESGIRSIYEVQNAEKCSIEVCSLSKNAGFTGLRCGWSVIPDGLEIDVGNGKSRKISEMWMRRQSVRFNGVSYITMRGAEAAMSEEGLRYSASCICTYKSKAKKLKNELDLRGISHVGGEESPYIWTEIPSGIGMTSWEFFLYLLEDKGIAVTPGVGFGDDGRFRLSSF